MNLTHRVRAIVTKDFSSVLLIKRTRPGVAPYWVFPGGGVEETDLDAESALRRELLEELGAEVEIMKLVFVTEEQRRPDLTIKESFYLCRLLRQDLTTRNGPEFSDPARGTYDLEWLSLDPHTLLTTNLKPEEMKDYLSSHAADLASVSSIPSPMAE